MRKVAAVAAVAAVASVPNWTLVFAASDGLSKQLPPEAFRRRRFPQPVFTRPTVCQG